MNSLGVGSSRRGAFDLRVSDTRYSVSFVTAAQMRKGKFSENTIMTILKAAEAQLAVRDVCREHKISAATYDRSKTRYGGM